MNNTVLIALRLTASLLMLAFLFAVYWLFNVYDWGPPLAKLGIFSALFVAIVGFQFLTFRRETPQSALLVEIGVLSIIFVSLLFIYGREYGPNALRPPVSDIGFTTEHAVRLLVNEHQNPYSTSAISALKYLPPGFRGFHYGPLMMVGYLPSVFFPERGYKLASIFYLLVSLALLAFLVIEPEETWATRLANILFVLTAFLLARKFWHELFVEGVNDIFPVMLILGALLALRKDLYFWTGLLTGLSFATKFSPALFLIPFLPVRQQQFRIGFGLGIIPLLLFLFWDFPGLVRNVFVVRGILNPDTTSLYSIVPAGYQWLMGATLLLAMIVSVCWNIRREIDYRTALIGFTLLLIVADATQKEVHGNHLIWFYPLFAIIFMYNRERLFGRLTT